MTGSSAELGRNLGRWWHDRLEGRRRQRERLERGELHWFGLGGLGLVRRREVDWDDRSRPGWSRLWGHRGNLAEAREPSP